jgi:hypothetical protein
MFNRLMRAFLLLALLVSSLGQAGVGTAAPAEDVTALLAVTLRGPTDRAAFNATGLPAYAMLPDGSLLSGADPAGQERLAQAGLEFVVLDPDLRSGRYFLAYPAPGRAAPQWNSYGRLLLEGSGWALLRSDPAQMDSLALAGVELQAITLTAKPLQPAETQAGFPQVITPDPLIQQMIDQVSSAQVSQYDRELAGELPVWVDGAWYTITAADLQRRADPKAGHYMGERMADVGLDVEYHIWNNDTNPNVIGEIPAWLTDQIFIIGGHLDDVTGSPGATIMAAARWLRCWPPRSVAVRVGLHAAFRFLDPARSRACWAARSTLSARSTLARISLAI